MLTSTQKMMFNEDEKSLNVLSLNACFLNVSEVLELEILVATTAECHEDVGKKIFRRSGAFAVVPQELEWQYIIASP